MEAEETEISKEELQSWIADEVHKAKLTSPGIRKKYSLLQSLLARRQRQATRFLQLCQSLMVFENTVKELYSQLGWEYASLDSESDDDAESTSCRRTLPFLFVSSEHRIQGPSASRVSTPRLSTPDSEEDQEETVNPKSPVAVLNKEAVVVLHKLTRSQIAATTSPPLSDADDVEDADLSFGESGEEWEPDRKMSDSEYFVSDFGARSNRKRKLKNRGKHEMLNSASKRSRKSTAKARRAKTAASSASKNEKGDCSVSKTSSLPANSDGDAESSQRDAKELPSNSRKTTKCLTSGTKREPQSTAKTKTTTAAKTTCQAETTKTTSPTCQAAVAQRATTPQSNTVSAESTVVKTFTPSASNKVGTPVSQQTSKTTGTPPNTPKIEIKLNMNVLARRKHLCWQRGKVAEIITKENGKVKYKITFEEKGKSLVSVHHLAYDGLPKLDELSIGCRVVVKCPGEKAEFQPGIMAELPGRKNRMRFLVYIDDHTPMYVGLPAIRLVYKPLANPLDDILDEHHKEFIREYLRTWPYPPQTQYKIGQVMHAEYEGTMQKCEVLTVDCSLIEVVFESDQHKEWLYRGSLRLEHMIKMKYSKWKEDKNCT